MNIDNQNRIIYLINGLINGEFSENKESEIYDELDTLISYPKWSDDIFWSDEYVSEDGVVDYDKFFDNIIQYKKSEIYQKHSYVINLAKDLLNKNFTQKDEVQLVNELNDIVKSAEWLDWLFVSKECLLENGTLNENCFIRKVFYK